MLPCACRPAFRLFPFAVRPWQAALLAVTLGATAATAQDGTQPGALKGAQTTGSSIHGTVRDPNQLVVPGAQVTLDGNSIHQNVVSDSTGRYLFATPAPGTYTVTASKPGFNASSTSLTVPAGIDLTRNLPQDISQDLNFTTVSDTSGVTVNGQVAGSPAVGYYVPNVDRGVLGDAPIVAQPYMITVLPAEQIANTQVKNLRDALKYLPLVSFTEQQGPEILRPTTRGVQGSIAQNIRMDGMTMAITGANAMEQYQELQVENGLGGPMYGPANPSGMFDFVLKRPTEERTSNIYLEQDSSSVGTVVGDFGGRLGPRNLFGYRSNLLFGDGTQFVQASRLRRRLAEFAFDVRVTDRTTLDAHYSVYDIVQRGYPGWFSYGESKVTGTPNPQDPPADYILPAAPDPTIRGFGQAYAGVNLTTQSTSARLLHDFSSNWHAMAGGLVQRLDRFMDTPVNTITSNAGTYSSALATGFAPRFGTESDLGYITGTINKFGLRQDVVLASEGYRFNQYGYIIPSPASVALGTASVAHPVIFAPPADGLPQNLHQYQATVVHQQGFNLGDTIFFPKRFAVRVAASQDWIGVDNNTIAAKTFVQSRVSGSNKNGISPSASVMYKPLPWMTAYGTYASSLQQGDIAPSATNLINSGQSLAPYRSKEWEIGFKTDAHPLAISSALFRIQRPFAETVSAGIASTPTENIFKIVGEQVNYGAEIQGQGTLFRRWLIDAGFTAINARLNNTGIAATNGKRFVGIPEYKSGFYSEYRIPGIARLSLTGDWQFIGIRPQDDENLHSTPGTNTYDLGFRYAHTLFSDKLATLRFTTQNLTNAHYYSTISAGDITGTNASANLAHLGLPRTISSSLQFSF